MQIWRIVTLLASMVTSIVRRKVKYDENDEEYYHYSAAEEDVRSAIHRLSVVRRMEDKK